MRVFPRLFPLVLVLLTIGCDRVTKHLAGETLSDQAPRSYLAGIVRLEYAENTGAFLGAGSGLPVWARFGLFRVGVALTLAAVVFVALKDRWTGLLLAGAAFVFAGGISNLFDRVARDSVIDFMSVGVGPLRTGIFNVADLAIVLGGALIVRGIQSGSRKR